MRDGITAGEIAAVSAPAITTALMARFDFKSETVCVWTGVGSITITGSGDSLLDGLTFDPVDPSAIGDIGENTYSLTGSEELTLTMAVPSEPSVSMAAAAIYPNEFQARPAILWRAVKMVQTDPLAQPVWVCRRIRAGKMDKLEITNDGQSHLFKLTIESHQANISVASNQTYLNQKTYDPNDTSQDYAVSIANGKAVPASANALTAGASGYQYGSSKFTSDIQAMIP